MQPAHASYVTFEEPDVVYWRLIGKVEESDIKAIYKEMLAFSKGKQHLFNIIDVTKLDTMTQAARHAAAGGPEPGKKVMPVDGTVVFGASFHIQVLGTLLTKAAKIINRNDDMVLHYCKSEAEARVWIAKRRLEVGA